MKHRLNSLNSFFIKLCKIPPYAFHFIKERGLRKAASHFCSELYSVREFIVTKHDLNSVVELPQTGLQITIAELMKDHVEDIEDICNVWPSEFGWWKPGRLKASLTQDLENDDWCFFARHNGSIIGAVWVFKKNKIIENCPVHHIPGERVLGRIFIVPEVRGMGLSKLLCNRAIKAAIERKVPHLFGLTYPERVASIKSKLRVGFKAIGRVTVKTRFGKETYKFVSETI